MNDFEFEIELRGVPSDLGVLSLEIKNEEITIYLSQESSHMDIRSCLLKLTSDQLFLIEDTFRNSLQRYIFIDGKIIEIKLDRIFTNNNGNGYIELLISNSQLNEIKKAFANACAMVKTKEFDNLMDELNDSNDPYQRFYKMEEDQAQAVEDRYYCGYTVYKDNGIEITAYPADGSYRFETSKYSVIWYTGGGISIYHSQSSIYDSKFILDVIFKFDLCYFIKGEFIGDGEGYNIEYCSDEYFHSKLNRFLNLKVFF